MNKLRKYLGNYWVVSIRVDGTSWLYQTDDWALAFKYAKQVCKDNPKLEVHVVHDLATTEEEKG